MSPKKLKTLVVWQDNINDFSKMYLKVKGLFSLYYLWKFRVSPAFLPSEMVQSQTPSSKGQATGKQTRAQSRYVCMPCSFYSSECISQIPKLDINVLHIHLLFTFMLLIPFIIAGTS